MAASQHRPAPKAAVVVVTLLLSALASDRLCATVAARSGDEAPPRISFQRTQVPEADALSSICILPFEDAPGAPGSGATATAALVQALTQRGLPTSKVRQPRDTSGHPTPAGALDNTLLAATARANGRQIIVTGSVLELQRSERLRPRVLRREPGAYLDLPPEQTFRTRVVLRFRAIAANGQHLFEASARYGPLSGVDEEAACREVMQALLEHWLGPAATADETPSSR